MTLVILTLSSSINSRCFVAVLIDYNEYTKLKQLEEYEDMLFWLAAKKAIKDWMAWIEETNNLLNSIK